MIYIDTSVALAHMLAEDKRPPESLWSRMLVASRLLEYELWNRLHARSLGASHGDDARELLGRIAYVELIPEVVGRAKEPFPVPVRTLDALHLASFHFLQQHDLTISMATYDARMLEAARRMKFRIEPLS